MAAQTLDQTTALSTHLDDVTYTLALLLANPLTAAFSTDFTALTAGWTGVNAQEIQLRTEIVKADALVAVADADIDVFVDALSSALLIITQNDRRDALYQAYFAGKRPSDVKRPILGAELGFVRAWIPSLVASPYPALTALGAQLQQKVAAADAAVAARAKAEQENHDFRALGARKAWIDQLNAVRQATFGKLAEMPYADPAKNLPSDFADRFFRHATHRTVKAPTSADINAKIADNKSEATALEQQLAETKAREDQDAKDQAQLQADQQALDALKKSRTDNDQQIAALEAKLAQEKKK